jgi:hypothetical protein
MRQRHTYDEDNYDRGIDDSHNINVSVSSGLLGDHIEQIKVPRDRDHPSNQTTRKLRRQLDVPAFPDFIVVLIVRMAASTFLTSILIEIVRNDVSGNLVWIVGIFTTSFLLSLWFYCARAIHTQPSLKWGVLYLWVAIMFGAILGAIF